MIDAGRGVVTCPITVLDFEAVTILGTPMEVLLDVAFDWQRCLPNQIALICGLFGGWIGYLPHQSNHAEPQAEQLYETISTMFAPDAATLLLEVARGIVEDLRS
jgi:hypothetical protein